MQSRYLIYMLLLMLFSACGAKVIFDEKVAFEPTGWDKDAPALFKVNQSDTSKVLDVGMTLLHSEDYAYSNIWLFIEVDGPEGLVQKDTLELFLANFEGEWLGKSKHDAIQVSAMYQYGVKLSRPGEYVFTITQGMRQNPLSGIKELSFWLQESEEPSK
jgi:gliding motility-associated lipoprotein GldH